MRSGGSHGQRGVVTGLLTLATCVMLVAGCPSDGDNLGPNVCRTIGPDGGTVTSDDGVLNLALRPGSLEESTEVCVRLAPGPPDGPPPVFGRAYRVTPDIELGVAVSVTYRDALPLDTSQTSIGIILRDDFVQGQGRWYALPVTRLEPENALVAGTDTRLSMFYGLLDDGGAGMASDSVGSDTDGDTDSGGSATTTSTTSNTTDDTTSGSTSSGVTSDSTTSDGTTSDDTSGGSTGTTGGGAVDCDALPALPLDIERVGGAAVFAGGGSEDIAMMGDGTFVGVSGNNILLSDAAGSTSMWFGPLASTPILGMKFDSGGDLYLANAAAASDTTISVISNDMQSLYVDGGFVFPNGVFLDSSGDLWVTDFSGNTVNRVDAGDQSVDPIATGGSINQPNGIFFDENRDIVYWSHYGQSQIWQATIAGDGTPGTPAMTADLPPGMNTDGITMDECGNLYAVSRTNDASPCRLERVFLDAAGDLDMAAGGVVELATDGDIGNGCANPVFGFGFSDEADNRSLWIAGNNGDVYRVELGLGGYPIPLP